MERKGFSLELEGFNIVGELYIPERQESPPALCICHGIPRGIKDPSDTSDPGYPGLARRFCDAGFLTMIFNFRGTGDSGGNFDILGWTRDLEAAIDYVYNLNEVDKARIFLMGFSGGAAVSVDVAAKDPRISHVVTCACPARFHGFQDPDRTRGMVEHFRSIEMIRDDGFPPSLEHWRDGFSKVSPIDHIDKISPRPVLIVHGTEDNVVDPSQAWVLYERAREPKEMLMVEGAGHRLRVEEKAMANTLKWLRSQAFGGD